MHKLLLPFLPAVVCNFLNNIVFNMWQTSANEFLQHISSWTNIGTVWAIDLVRGVWLSQLLHMDLHCLHLPTGHNDNDDGDDVEDDHGEVPQSTVEASGLGNLTRPCSSQRPSRQKVHMCPSPFRLYRKRFTTHGTAGRIFGWRTASLISSN